MLPYSDRPQRLIHVVKAELPDGMRMTLMGVTVFDPNTGFIRAVVMTIEGLVLFDASVKSEQINVFRAFSPFDKPGFAKGLLQDLQFLFMAPAHEPERFGSLKTGASICRYELSEGMMQDVIVQADGNWEIRQYQGGPCPVRSALGTDMQEGIAGAIDLQCTQPKLYRLYLHLLSAEPFQPDVAR